MNAIPGIVESVNRDDQFAQVVVNYNGLSLSACVLHSDNELPYCKKGAQVELLFKESDTIISLGCESLISCRNLFHVQVTAVSKTSVMARVSAQVDTLSLTSLITRGSFDVLGIREGMVVWYLVKSTSCMLTIRG